MASVAGMASMSDRCTYTVHSLTLYGIRAFIVVVLQQFFSLLIFLFFNFFQ